jgi:glycerol-3-phosphate dehydrogenase
LYAGAILYKVVAGKHSLGANSWIGHDKTRQLFPDLNPTNLHGSVGFYDAQMNEEKLGAWVAGEAKKSGVKIHEHTKVDRFTENAEIVTSIFGTRKYDFIVNAAGPWAAQLNTINNIETKYYLRLIRGSPLLLNI